MRLLGQLRSRRCPSCCSAFYSLTAVETGPTVCNSTDHKSLDSQLGNLSNDLSDTRRKAVAQVEKIGRYRNLCKDLAKPCRTTAYRPLFRQICYALITRGLDSRQQFRSRTYVTLRIYYYYATATLRALIHSTHNLSLRLHHTSAFSYHHRKKSGATAQDQSAKE